MILKQLPLILLVLIATPNYSQNPKLQEGITENSYGYLEAQIKDGAVADSLKIIYIDAFLSKAKKAKDTIKIGDGYYYKIYKELYFKDGEDLLSQTLVSKNVINNRGSMADSMIDYTKALNHYKFPGLSYSTRSYLYYYAGNEIKSLENALIAYKYAIKQNNQAQIKDLQKTIHSIKSNYASNAKKEIQKLDSIRKTFNYNDSSFFNYFATLKNLITDLQKERKIALAKVYTKEGIEATISTDCKNQYYSFVFSAGINHYFDNNFSAALDSINKSQSHLDINGISLAQYLKGKIFEKTDKDKALGYFIKVDSIFQLTHAPIYGLRDNYKSMLAIYTANNVYNKQLETIDKLLKADSITNSTKLYIDEKIFTEYELPEFKKEKEAIILKLKEQNSNSKQKNLYLWTTIVVIGLFGYYFFYRQRVYIKRYKNVLQSLQITQNEKKTEVFSISNNKIDELNIPESTIENVLKALENFELQKHFIKNTVTLNSLSKQFSTNSTYLSKIINSHKDKSFSSYITNLRIDYVVNELYNNHILRKMSIKAIASEIGFNNSESFSKAFYRKTGIYPSYFIKQIEKENKKS